MSETKDSPHPAKRHPGNPILTAADFPRPVNTVFNAAAARFGDETILLCRVEGLEGWSTLWIARSRDGVRFIPDPEPAITCDPDGPLALYEGYSVEDPRITRIGDVYYITYVCYGPLMCVTALARTTDFRTFEKLGLITLPENKDVVLFPEKIGGLYAKLDRPMTQTEPRGDIWISYSPDLVYWGRPEFVMAPRPRGWDNAKIGAGAPPVRTDAGWLEIYHGVRETCFGSVYRLGAVLLDLENPARVLGRAREAVLSPHAPEERTGNVGNVVFTCGVVPGDDGELRIYYGAADHVMCLATIGIDDLVERCLQGDRPS